MSEDKAVKWTDEKRRYLWMDFNQMSIMLIIIPCSLTFAILFVWAGLTDTNIPDSHLTTKGFWIGVAPILLYALKTKISNNKAEKESKK